MKPLNKMLAIQEITTPNCDQTNSSKKRKKYVVRKRKGYGVPVVDPTLVPRKFTRFNEISNDSTNKKSTIQKMNNNIAKKDDTSSSISQPSIFKRDIALVEAVVE